MPSTTDTSMYNTGSKPSQNSSMNELSALQQMAKLKQNMQQGTAMSSGNTTSTATTPTQNSSAYGSGTDMALLGAGAPYGGSTN